MPKRTNQFQQLIAYITEQVAPVGAIVKESAELFETGIDGAKPREVDVLIELDIGLSQVRIALECRDRTRKDDVEWIDGLIGKYTNMTVDKVIAVSNSGFSKTAIKKAERHNIDTMTLGEASEADWPKRFLKLGLATTKQEFVLQAVTFKTEPEVKAEISMEDIIIIKSASSNDAIERGTVAEFIKEMWPKFLERIKQYVRENYLGIYTVVADLKKVLKVEWEVRVPTQDYFLETRDSGRHRLVTIAWEVIVYSSYARVDVERRHFSDKAMVTTGVIPDKPESGYEIKISAVQVADKVEGKVFFEAKKRKRRKR